jgi:hypothetical protein
MAIHHLMLPSFIEPPPRIPVAARYGGPVLASMRRQSGYRFTEADRHRESNAWMERAAPRRV